MPADRRVRRHRRPRRAARTRARASATSSSPTSARPTRSPRSCATSATRTSSTSTGTVDPASRRRDDPHGARARRPRHRRARAAAAREGREARQDARGEARRSRRRVRDVDGAGPPRRAHGDVGRGARAAARPAPADDEAAALRRQRRRGRDRPRARPRSTGSSPSRSARKIEAELAELEPAERAEFLEAEGLEEPGLNALIREAYRLLGLQSFFTAGPKEVRAWTVRDRREGAGGGRRHPLGLRARLHQGRGHRATPTTTRSETEAAAKAAGKLRVEGKEYVVAGRRRHALPLQRLARRDAASRALSSSQSMSAGMALVLPTIVKPVERADVASADELARAVGQHARLRRA